MAIKFTTTEKIIKRIICLVYGDSGIGKTKLIDTCPNPLIISAEKGLLTLSDQIIPVIEIETYDDLMEAHKFILTNKKAQQFETICLDSISSIAEKVIIDLKKQYTDPRQAYGEIIDTVISAIEDFKKIPGKNIYFIAKAKRVIDEYTGITSWVPSMPGKQLGPALPYLFDFVLPMRMGVDGEGKEYRYLQTAEDIQWVAKIRTVVPIPQKVEPHLGKLFDRVLGKKKEKKKEKIEEPEELKAVLQDLEEVQEKIQKQAGEQSGEQEANKEQKEKQKKKQTKKQTKKQKEKQEQKEKETEFGYNFYGELVELDGQEQEVIKEEQEPQEKIE